MQTDTDFLGLTPTGEPGRFTFSVIERLARLDGRLYGGSAIAVSIAAAELTSQRSALWMTTQFVSTVDRGTTVAVHAEVLAAGTRTNQVRVTATSETGETVFASLGATGIHRPDGLTGEFERCPRVDPPAAAERWASPFTALAKAAGITDLSLTPRASGFASAIEMRGPAIHEHPDPGPGRVCVWVRRQDQVAITPAVAAFLADIVPMGLAHALGVLAGGTSLDNTIRIGGFTETEWILIDLRPHLAVGGYGHGIAHVWSEGGQLLATASQTASMIKYDATNLPGVRRT